VILHNQIFGCLVLMSVASLPAFRRRAYEIFRMIHFGCSTSICILLWLHVPQANKAGRAHVIVGTCIWAATYAHRNVLLVYRNFSVSKPSTRIQVESVHNSLQVKVRLPRPWKVRPGQYVYLTMMRPGFFSILQRHPFMVAGSEAQDHDFQLRIQPRTGLTSRLLTRTLGGTREFSAFVEGPYGHGFDLQNFGTVVLFASGIGIVGHLAYIQKLVLDYRQSKTKTRDLLVVWHVDNKYQLDLVWEVMNNVLRRDDLPATAVRRDARAPYGSGKMDRHLGSSSSSTSESPGLRPAPHGENASVAAWRSNVTKR
jgi:predicted ferric reductase